MAIGPLKHGAKANGEVKKIYRSWQMMKNRCYNKNALDYSYYGGRGITVCARWKDSFINFQEDMGEPSTDQSLDRIDNNGNYEPSNCRWATRLEQARNRDYCIKAEYKGKVQHTWEWAVELGIDIETFRSRLRQHKNNPDRYNLDFVFGKKYESTNRFKLNV